MKNDETAHEIRPGEMGGCSNLGRLVAKFIAFSN